MSFNNFTIHTDRSKCTTTRPISVMSDKKGKANNYSQWKALEAMQAATGYGVATVATVARSRKWSYSHGERRTFAKPAKW